MNGRILVCAAILGTGLTLGAQVAERPGVQLQAAIKLALVDGDLKGAIDLFKRIADSGSPTEAAEALVHMAGAYEKLGQPAEARRAYERVVREFGGQEKFASTANAWLAAHPTAAVLQPIVQARRLWTAQGAIGPLSRDGRYVAFADWTTGSGNLALRDLQTGETRLLTRDGSQKTGWVGDTLISPDGTQIAYRWEGGPNESTRLIRADGTGMRILYRQPYGEGLNTWSPDGKWIVGLRHNYPDRSVQTILISTADGSVQRLKSMEWQQPALGGFSPDGRFLVYAWPTGRDEGAKTNVYTLAVDGTRETLVAADTAFLTAPAWSPDGQRVFFHRSNPTGAPEIWAVRVAEGRPVGESRLIVPRTPGTESAPSVDSVGFTADGSYYYSVRNRRVDAYIATLDPETLTVMGTSLVTDLQPGSNSNPELAPDGQRVAFFRSSPPREKSLVIRSMATGQERSLGPFPNVNGGIQWFPDGRSLLVMDGGTSGGRFRKVNVETGAAEPLFQDRGSLWPQTPLSPDGRAIYYTRTEVGLTSGPTDLKHLRLMKRVLATGEETELYRTDSRIFGYQGLSVSLDGAWLAFSFIVGADQRSVMIMPSAGGAPREVHRADWRVISHLGAFAWTHDGRHLVVTGQCGPGGTEALCALSRDGGELKLVGQNLQSITSRMISSDGRRIAFTGTSEERQLWVMRGLLTAP